jgi:uncharacterized RDD family membrane protein YckC
MRRESSMHTHYDNLKVMRGAPAEVIKAAYRALSQRYHPDRRPGPEAERVMRLLNEAYAVLGDPVRREAYDRELAAYDRQASNQEFADARHDSRHDSRSGEPGGAAESPAKRFAQAIAFAYTSRAPLAPALGLSVARCFARLFDVGWEAAAVGVATAVFLGTHWRAFSAWIAEPGNPVLFAMLCLPIAMMVDASVYRITGNTPGKALLGLKVTALDGGRLSWKTYLRRNLAVWARGLGCGIPVVNLVTMWRRGREASAGADVAYDVKTGHQVSAREIGVARKAVFGVLCVALVGAAVPGIAKVTDQWFSDTPSIEPAFSAAIPVALHAHPRTAKRASSAPSHRESSSWTNPLTAQTAAVDGAWHASSMATTDQETIQAFTARDGRTTVFFAEQERPTLSMGEYVLEYLRGAAGTMDLSPPDSAEHVGASDAWIANGHLNASPDVAVHVELRHIGQSYWRVIVLRPHDASVPDDAVQQLVQRLWATVPGV